MNGLVISYLAPPRPGRTGHGVYQRLRLFVDALSDVCTGVKMVHFVKPGVDDVAGPGGDATAAGHPWNPDFALDLIPLAERHETFARHYIDPVWSASLGRRYYSYCSEPQIDILRRHLQEEYDIIFVHRFHAMLAYMKARQRDAALFFDLDDVEHIVALRHMLAPPLWPGKVAHLAHAPAIYLAERRAARIARHTFVCSEIDRRRLERLRMPRVTAVPNAVRAPADPPPLPAAPTILFLGACGYPPNADAAERLVTRVFPLVRQRVPDARLLIAGDGSRALPSAQTPPPGVAFLGYVDDLDALYAQSRVICCPLMTGGGTRIKLIEAAGFARPIVSTRVGAEGLDFADGQAIVLRDDDRGLAAACADLLRDDALATTLGAAARRMAVAVYDREHIRARVAGLFAAGVARPAAQDACRRADALPA